MNVTINWFALLSCVVAAASVGFVWYGPLFGSLWAKLSGLKEKDLQKDMMTPMGIMLGLSFVQAFALRHFIVFAEKFYPNYSSLAVGLLTAWWAWLGFVFCAMTIAYAFGRKPWSLIIIDTFYQLVTLLLFGTILSLWV